MTINLRRRSRDFLALLILLGISHSSIAQNSAQNEFLLFPSIGGFDTQDESDPSVKDSHLQASVDVLYSYTSDHFRFLAEYLLSTEEAELERLKAGFVVADNAIFWLGRFHSPARFWVNEFHHGQYLQTSITRPGLEAWEDESGSTPTHVTGFLLEVDRISSNDSAVDYALSVGMAPRFIGSELEAFDTLDPRSGHGLSVSARIGYRPRYFETSSFGLLFSWNEINAESVTLPEASDVTRIDQFTAGFFVNWQWRDVRLITSAAYYENDIHDLAGVTTEDFVLSYFQPEYRLNDEWTLFGRADIGFGEDASTFLRMLPSVVAHRNMLGLRWDFADFQALTMEIADVSKQDEDDSHLNHKEVRLQWSAVFP